MLVGRRVSGTKAPKFCTGETLSPYCAAHTLFYLGSFLVLFPEYLRTREL